MNIRLYKSFSQSFSALLILTAAFLLLLNTDQARADVLAGVKIAMMDLDFPARKDPVNVAFNFGYEFDSLIADLSLIGEVSRTAYSGETGGGKDLDFESESAYILWKTTRSLFVSLRGGLVKNKIITGNQYRRGDGILLGGSVGIVIGRTRLQVEYTSLAGDADFLGVGLEFWAW
jgi:hypothetical protein